SASSRPRPAWRTLPPGRQPPPTPTTARRTPPRRSRALPVPPAPGSTRGRPPARPRGRSLGLGTHYGARRPGTGPRWSSGGNMSLNDDRLFDADPTARGIARELYAGIRDLPLVSPHGHTDPRWYAENEPFPDPARLLIVPDHYIFRMLFSQGLTLEELGVPDRHGQAVETDGRAIWRRFAANYYLFRGTPTRLWLDHTLVTLFGIEQPLGPQ